MRAVFPPVLLLMLAWPGAAASAQTVTFDTPKPAGPTASYVPAGACPVQFFAQRYGLAGTVRQTAQGEVQEFTQSLRLRFSSVDLVQSIEIVVHGRTPKAEVLPLSTDPPETASQTFRFNRSERAFDRIRFLQTNTVPLITRLELTRVEYTDGSIWREAAPGTCSVQPSLLVLVDAAAR